MPKRRKPENTAGRHTLHLLLLTGSKQGELPHSSVHRRRNGKAQRAHPAPAHPAGRPPGKHLSPRGRVPQRPGAVRGINGSIHYPVTQRANTSKAWCCTWSKREHDKMRYIVPQSLSMALRDKFITAPTIRRNIFATDML